MAALKKGRRGFALIIVLGAVVLVTLLIVGFLTRAKTELAASSAFKASAEARQLADRAVSLVQGQIHLASTEGPGVAWVSQPGLVRTFNNSNGNLVHAYKLYSAGSMVSNAVSLTTDQPSSGWTSLPAEWVDLNAPFEVGGIKQYPILDPSAQSQPVEGFSISNAPGVTASSYQQAPMPVRWLYALQDGSLVTPSSSTPADATIPGASDGNPVVGRIAFWTDDDSCKININTASEGTYWDTPRAASTQEMNFASRQPVQKEWQRYPGHPATTSLSVVYPSATASQIYDIVPKVNGGGSVGGTVTATAAIVPDTNRLYASVDELLFKPDRTGNGGLNKSVIERSRFFLTARSRAPETTLFNTPRIACWPIYRLGTDGTPVAARTTSFDRLIAFCASTGKIGSTTYYPYIFQRQLSTSGTNDINIARNLKLYAYLQYLTGQPFPGFGGNFSAKYGVDRDQILTEIFDYIRCVNLSDSALLAANRFTSTGAVLPTKFSSGAQTTLGFGRNWTLSEFSMQFICNARADDPATVGLDESAGSNEAVTNVPLNKYANAVLGGVPLVAGERYVQAIIIPEFFAPMQGWLALAPTVRIKITGLGAMLLEGKSLFPNLDAENATIANSSAVYLTALGGPVGFRMFGANQCSPARGGLPADTVAAGQYAYPFISLPVKITPVGTTMHVTATNVTVEIYPGTGVMDSTTIIQKIPIHIPAGDFPIPNLVTSGTTKGDYATTQQAWWGFSRKGVIDPGTSPARYPGRLANISSRTWADDSTNSCGGGSFIRDGFDTVRSMLPSHGDYRIVAGSFNVPDTLFVQHPLYATTTARMAHNLNSSPISGGGQGDGRGPGYDNGGKYMSAFTYPKLLAPDIPSNSSLLPETTGDFDTGLSLCPDGPFINKPDEGNVSGLSTGDIPYFSTSWTYTDGGSTFFSPNRQIPSPGMLGSLPSRTLSGEPWRTLLFRPQVAHPADQSHYTGNAKIQDHLLLDLFWMPVVEPYAISDRFSTAGKINMNYQILPFTYIKRSTGIRALLKSEKVASIANDKIATYKPAGVTGTNAAIVASNPDFRLAIDPAQTLSQFESKFDLGEVFKSASEVCDLHIVPQGQTAANMTAYWSTHQLTGENLREKIYTTLYPRLTTKSNTFTVHFRSQSLKKLKGGNAGIWEEGKDKVTGEFRGSTTVERFIDANNSSIPDYAANPASIGTSTAPTLDHFYKWRVVENRKFAP